MNDSTRSLEEKVEKRLNSIVFHLFLIVINMVVGYLCLYSKLDQILQRMSVAVESKKEANNATK